MFKEMIQSVANFIGYEIMSLDRAQGQSLCVAGILNEKRINVVLDVGANFGQFAQWIRKLGYEGRIVSFEPLTEAHQQLTRVAARDSQWAVAPRMALGSASGEVEIHVAGNSASSSVLPMLAVHRDASPESRYVDVEKAPLKRLDDACPFSQGERPLLKIDVQGYEMAVLDGATQLLANCEAIIIEMSLVPLYEGQPLAIDLWQYLTRLGFEACYFSPGFRDPQSRHLLQMDGVFVRR
jgi:FkbM family methyltransferase